MICEKCKKDFNEYNIHESHDVPTYLWEGNRAGRKNQVDKLGRHMICKGCHDDYENKLRVLLRATAYNFAVKYFKDREEEDDGLLC